LESTVDADAPPGRIDRQLAVRAAQSDCTILITGETGSGKGHLARWLHQHSRRHDRSFIPVNCGAIPETLIDSQLFGHARGAFSGATTDHIGLVRAAQRGTLLLDEVSELPHTAQLRLLRLLQDREVQPVGHSRPILVDVRVMAATNIDLEEAVSARTFREDLFFRLDVIQIEVAPLRERTNQIPRLLAEFNAEFAALYQQNELSFSDESRQLLSAYHWPGNIRELRTVVERLHVLCPGANVDADMLRGFGKLQMPGISADLQREIDHVKRLQVERVLAETGGSVARAAAIFGVHRSTIYRWMNRSVTSDNG
jgi:DNA-binding NtrC family response regulator